MPESDYSRLRTAAPFIMGGGIPDEKMSQSGSRAMASTALYGVIPFFWQVAANVWCVEKFFAAVQLGWGDLRRDGITYSRIRSSVELLCSGMPG